MQRIRFKSRFYGFFNESKRRHFIPKLIGDNDNHLYSTADTILNWSALDDLSVFVKMDIEGGEYNSLYRFEPFFDKINGFIIEFHDIERNGLEFKTLLSKLLTQFYIAHVHGNNHAKYIKNTDIPSVLEITFINKKMMTSSITLSKRQYPIKGLDAPNNPYKKDMILKFNNLHHDNTQ